MFGCSPLFYVKIIGPIFWRKNKYNSQLGINCDSFPNSEINYFEQNSNRVSKITAGAVKSIGLQAIWEWSHVGAELQHSSSTTAPLEGRNAIGDWGYNGFRQSKSRAPARQRRRLHCHGGCSAVGVPFTLISLICRSLRLWMLLLPMLPVLPSTDFLLCFWFFPHFLLMACNMLLVLVLLFLALMFFDELRRLAEGLQTSSNRWRCKVHATISIPVYRCGLCRLCAAADLHICKALRGSAAKNLRLTCCIRL